MAPISRERGNYGVVSSVGISSRLPYLSRARIALPQPLLLPAQGGVGFRVVLEREVFRDLGTSSDDREALRLDGCGWIGRRTLGLRVRIPVSTGSSLTLRRGTFRLVSGGECGGS